MKLLSKLVTLILCIVCTTVDGANNELTTYDAIGQKSEDPENVYKEYNDLLLFVNKQSLPLLLLILPKSDDEVIENNELDNDSDYDEEDSLNRSSEPNDSSDSSSSENEFNLEQQKMLRWRGCCDKKARKVCVKACKKALKTYCWEFKCKSRIKSKFRSQCKAECKRKFKSRD